MNSRAPAQVAWAQAQALARAQAQVQAQAQAQAPTQQQRLPQCTAEDYAAHAIRAAAPPLQLAPEWSTADLAAVATADAEQNLLEGGSLSGVGGGGAGVGVRPGRGGRAGRGGRGGPGRGGGRG